MKIILSLALFLALPHLLPAQSVAQGVSGNVNTDATNAAYAVVARRANSRVWAKDVAQTNGDGRVSVKRKSYTEVAANLCVQNAAGVWSDSVGGLSIVADGASSGNSPLAVHFSGDANANGGTVTLTGPDGKVFVSKVFGISYYDPTIQKNTLIATLKNSAQGFLVGNNQILYQNAFTGLDADIRYTFSLSGCEQDIILHDNPPSPDTYGLNVQSSRMQVWTEWFNPPQPSITTAVDDGITHDAYIDFGNMFMGPGAAFFTQGQNDPAPVETGAIYKHWQQINGRNFLVEEIRYPVVANLLQGLPLHASAMKPGKNLYEHIASTQPLLPKTGKEEPGTPVQVAKNLPRQAGVVLDYNLVSSVANFTFQSDTTYYLTTNVTMSGTNTTFEGGTVLKYVTNVTMTVNSPVTWLAGSYRPVILTAQDDDVLGDTIDISTGNPGTNYYASTALYFNAVTAGTNLILQHLRVMNAATAVAINGQTNHVLSHVQMVNCGNGLAATNATFSLLNGLMYKVMTNFTGTNSTGDVEHLTVDTANLLNTNLTLNLTNCLLAVVTTSGSFTSNSTFSVSTTNVFQTLGSGSHYLATNSPYVNAGTTNINPTLAIALMQMTTYPPVKVSGYVITNTTYSPQVQRDIDIPDVGYHYDPIDYAINVAITNATVTVLPGTVFGKYGNYCFSAYQVATINCQGTATSPNYMVAYNTVQEQSNTKWPTTGAGNVYPSYATSFSIGDTLSVADFRFTFWMVMAGDEHLGGYEDAYASVGLQDCQFFSGGIADFGSGMYVTNCLFQRTYLDIWDVDYANFTNRFCNNLCIGSTISLSQGLAGPWTFQNNLFDQAVIQNPLPSGAVCGYNAYVTTANGLLTATTTTGDIVLTASPAYQTGPLGRNYYPTNLALIYAGSTSAVNAGVGSETVTTNNTGEGTNSVSIGFHYSALTYGTNCGSAPGGALSISYPSFCVGEPAFDGANWTDVPGQTNAIFLGPDGRAVEIDYPAYSTIVTNWSVVDWDGVLTTNGGSGLFFTPTNTGVGTNVFYYTYSNSTPCSTGPYTISISNTFAVVGVASLAPTNTGTWIEITNSTPGTRTFLVQANPTNGYNTLAVYATPTPSVAPTNLPFCWSLNGVVTNVTVLSIAAPTVYEVVCSCGTSSLTDFFIVTTNAVTTNSTVDAPCGTGPWQLGYWSFNAIPLLDYWTGNSTTNDSAGTNNAVINGNVTYTTNGYSSNAFSFDGTNSYLTFGTNVGNFGTNNFSVDLWMETTATNGQAILGKRPNYGAGSLWDLSMTSNGTITCEVCQNSTGSNYTDFTSQRVVNDGFFHHVTLTRWRTNVSLYIDDSLDTTASLPGIANIQNSTNLTAGRASCTPVTGTTNFAGVLDEIKLAPGDINPWVGTNDHHPLQYYNLQNPATPWTNGVLVDSPNAAKLAYNYLEADGTANLNGGQGAVRFWFNPDWNGGTGTGAPGYWFELGDVYAPGGGWALTADPGGTGLSLVSGSNGVMLTYFTAPIAGWVSNQWHQIVLSYSTNATLLFIDGGLVTTGPGLFFEPDLATRLADGFTVGSDHNGSGEAGGVFDELATFNCPLAQSDVIADYPAPAILTQPLSVTVNNGSTAFFTVVADSATAVTNQWQLNGANLTASDRVTGTTTNYTGAATNLLTVADVMDSDAGSYTVVVTNSVGTLTSATAVLTVNDAAQLGGWLFATTNWAGLQGQLPLLATNVAVTAAWSSNGAVMDTNVAARLVYRDVETNGSANINCRVGSVVLWFKPDWSSTNAGGSGPLNAARFIELGSYGTNDWWALCLDSAGTNLSFCTETNGSLTTNAAAAVSWTNNTWHQVAVTYGTDAVRLYVDGTEVTYSSTNVTKWPRRAVRDQGISVGSDATGALQIRGLLADLETYNYELASADLEDDYNAIWGGGAVNSAGFGALTTSNEFALAGIGGWPSASMTILVNSTNFMAAAWIPFNPWPVVDLGSGGDGLRTVNFYFKGLNGGVGRVTKRVWLDTTPPTITITSPGSNTLNRPVLQLQGYANEDVSSISYDLTNASGLVTNENVLVLSRYFDTNQWRFTTNAFQAFDIGLTAGTNTITVHAMDIAGNQTTSNFVYVLDYSTKTNPPVLALYWPTNGALISGTNFAWRGSVDDPTVVVSAQIVDTNGDTNVLGGLVERNGNWWVESLPLMGGTNWLTLTATDGAGNVSATNIAVVQSGVSLSITSIPGISNQTVISVSGTIPTGGYTVWVNGIATTPINTGAGYWAWTADNVPVNGTGTTLIEALAITNTDSGGAGMNNGGGGTNSTLLNPGNPTPHALSPVAQVEQDKLPVIIYTSYHQKSTTANDSYIASLYGVTSLFTYTEDWTLGVGGSSSQTQWSAENNGDVGAGEGFAWYTNCWDAFGNGSQTTGYSLTNNDYSQPDSPADYSNILYTYWAASSGRTADYDAATVLPETGAWEPGADSDTQAWTDSYVKTMSYVQGGKAVPVQYVVAFSASAGGAPSGTEENPEDNGRAYQNWEDIPPTDITMATGRLGSDSIYYKVVPSGAPMFDVTPGFDGGPLAARAFFAAQPNPGAWASSQASQPYGYYTFNVGATAHKAYIQATTSIGTSTLAVTSAAPAPGFCVGQYVTFSVAFDPTLPEQPRINRASWGFPLSGTFFNDATNADPALNYPQCSSNYYINPVLLKAPNTRAWWVSGGNGTDANKPAKYQVACTEKLWFTNGDNCTISPKGWFNMYRPQAKIFAVTASVEVVNDPFVGGWVLRFAKIFVKNGISFSNTITYPTNFTGSVQWVQIVETDQATYQTIDSTNHVLTNNTTGPWLDMAVPYPNLDLAGNTYDSPYAHLSVPGLKVDRLNTFHMWMMFIPPGLGVSVPLRNTPWHWSGTAISRSGSWQLQSGSDNFSNNPTDSDAQQYPKWIGIGQSHYWNPPLQ